MHQVGEELKSARERRGMSFDDVYKTTKIDAKFLEALEEGNYSILPEPYLKAFIKAYAGAVGANTANIMRMYEEFKSSLLPDEPVEEVQVEQPQPSVFRENLLKLWESHKKSITLVAGGILGIFIIIFAVSVIPKGDKSASSQTIKVTAEGKVDTSGINFRVSASSSVYLMVSIDGGDSLDYNLMNGGIRDFHGEDNLWIFTSNVGAVVFALNGTPVNEIAGDGLSAHFKVDSTGVRDIVTYERLVVNR